MCTALAAATMRYRMATTWIITSPAIFITRMATIATITVHWFPPNVKPRLPGSTLPCYAALAANPTGRRISTSFCAERPKK
jgi:hypothetical protein